MKWFRGRSETFPKLFCGRKPAYCGYFFERKNTEDFRKLFRVILQAACVYVLQSSFLSTHLKSSCRKPVFFHRNVSATFGVFPLLKSIGREPVIFGGKVSEGFQSFPLPKSIGREPVIIGGKVSERFLKVRGSTDCRFLILCFSRSKKNYPLEAGFLPQNASERFPNVRGIISVRRGCRIVASLFSVFPAPKKITRFKLVFFRRMLPKPFGTSAESLHFGEVAGFAFLVFRFTRYKPINPGNLTINRCLIANYQTFFREIWLLLEKKTKKIDFYLK